MNIFFVQRYKNCAEVWSGVWVYISIYGLWSGGVCIYLCIYSLWSGVCVCVCVYSPCEHSSENMRCFITQI